MPTTVKSRFNEIARELGPRMDDAIKGVANAIAVDAKFRVPVQTTKLRNAIHVRRFGDAEYRVLAGDDDAWYGHLVEFGTQAHTIPNAFGRGIEVEHPGAVPKPFLVPALERARPSLEAIVRNELADL